MSASRPFVRRRWTIAALVVVVVAAIAVPMIGLRTPDPGISPSIAQRRPDAARGEYIAVLGDCAACHTAPGGKPFAGGVQFPTPLGMIYSTNITPDRDTGIGAYSFKDFVRAMRQGVRSDGGRLYPAMPYTAFAKVSDEDLQDLFAYLQRDVAPVKETARQNAIAWPLSIRWPIAFWNLAFHDTARFAADTSRDAKWNRGGYLVQGWAHCGTCHTPRGIAFEEKDVSGRTNLYLSGTELAGTTPINLRGNDGDGLGRWTASDIAASLKSGRNANSAVTGPMGELVAHSTQFMSNEDVEAIATYVKSLSPAPESGRATFTASEATLNRIMAGGERSPGGQIYMDSCAACHRLSGTGANFAFPSLAGNPSVLSVDPSSLIAVILNGSRLPSTAAAPSGLAMPPFGWRYDDADIAKLATFVRSSWGNGGAPVTDGDVAKVRKQLGTSQQKSASYKDSP